jgi:DNA-binding transcriptional MerR regulator
MTPELLTIKQVAAETGLNVHTLRYYERIGLIAWIDRAENSHRRYDRDDVSWIQFLMKLRAIGMPIQDMLLYSQLQRQGDETLAQRLAMLKHLRDNLRSQVAEVQQHLALLDYKVDVYGLEVERQLQAVE